MKTIETDRLIIRDFEMNDAEDLQEILGDEETMKYCEPVYDIAKTKAFLKNFCIDRKGAVAAVLRETNKLIGYILFIETESGVYEIGWFFNRKYWGKGYAFEACSKIVDYAFSECGADKVFAETTDTVRSVNLMKKLGMRFESVQHLSEDCFGNPSDLHIYGITKK